MGFSKKNKRPTRWGLDRQRKGMWITKKQNLKVMSQCDIFWIRKSSQLELSAVETEGAKPDICGMMLGSRGPLWLQSAEGVARFSKMGPLEESMK